MSDDETMSELEKREAHARSMGGPEKLARRRESGLLNARERVDYILDDDSFLKSGFWGRHRSFLKIATRHRQTAKSRGMACSTDARSASFPMILRSRVLPAA